MTLSESKKRKDAFIEHLKQTYPTIEFTMEDSDEFSLAGFITKDGAAKSRYAFMFSDYHLIELDRYHFRVDKKALDTEVKKCEMLLIPFRLFVDLTKDGLYYYWKISDNYGKTIPLESVYSGQGIDIQIQGGKNNNAYLIKTKYGEAI